jgi:hypothetical protein
MPYYVLDPDTGTVLQASYVVVGNLKATTGSCHVEAWAAASATKRLKELSEL